MKSDNSIESLYRRYLGATLTLDSGRDICQALHQVGLERESQALDFYLRHGIGAVSSIQGRDWDGRRCFIGAHLPLQAAPGDIWFDVVELVPMILIHPPRATSIQRYRWISMHPAYVWQFRTFLHLADWHIIQKYFMNVSDLMLLDRFQSMNSMDFITNIYHEEAVAYAHWFGKYLCGQFGLQWARDFLKLEAFMEILPASLRLWDEAEYSRSEFVRVAVGRHTLDKDPDDEFELRENEANETLPNRVLYEEWDHTPDIGLSTMISGQIGLLQDLPRKAYEFIELRNAAPRPRT